MRHQAREYEMLEGAVRAVVGLAPVFIPKGLKDSARGFNPWCGFEKMPRPEVGGRPILQACRCYQTDRRT